ncbi:MAG: pilus assembly protein PilM, partial [Sedimentisphaerales bacterium]
TVVFGRGGQISFVKQIPIGGDKFNRQVAAKLGVSISEAEILRERLRNERAADSSSVGIENGRWASGTDSASKGGLDASTRQVMVDAIGAVAEELAREISLCFKYYTVTFRGKRVERAVLAGGEAYENILLNVLRRQLTVEIETAQPLRGFDMMNVNFESDKRGLLCEWAVAVGLGLKGFKGATD